MGQWTLNVGNMKVDFLTSKSGALGVKFNSSEESGKQEYYVPTESDKKIPKYDQKNPTENFHDRRYGENHLKKEEVVVKYYDKEKPKVYIDVDKMKKMYPLTKEAKVISKQPISKLNLNNISASDGYYMMPVKDYDNIQKYKKLIEYLGGDFVLTSPIRLRVGSVKDHNYAIYVDKSENALVMMEVLVKGGFQPKPDFGGL